MTAALKLEGVAKIYPTGGGLEALSLEVRRGEIAVVVGPSGCGKTTALRIAAGLAAPDRGRVFLDGKDVTSAPPEARGLGVVFQHYALFPHLRAEGNVAYGLRARGRRGDDLKNAVEGALKLVGLGGKGRRALDELSGGEQQRVAVARAIAPEPAVLLCDEPLSNLDAGLRRKTREELRSLVARLGLAALYVTHDQEEALALADRIYVLRAGALEQEGPPEDVYARPRSAFVARFLGGAFVLRARAVGEREAEIAPGVRLPSAPAFPNGASVDLAVRPECVGLGRPGPDAPSARVVSRTFVGADVVAGLEIAGFPIEARLRAADPASRVAVGDTVGVRLEIPVHAMPVEAGA